MTSQDELRQLREGFGILQEALIEISARATSGEWTLPSSFRACADEALRKAVYRPYA